MTVQRIRTTIVLLNGANLAAFGGALPYWITGGALFAVGVLMLLRGE